MAKVIHFRTLILLAAAVCASGADWYVSPSGTAGSAGTYGDPLSLAKALSATSPAQPGDTIWLRGGTYTGTITSELVGTEAQPITVRQVAGERAILDGNGASNSALTVEGGWTNFRDFEIFNSNPDRTPATPEKPFGVYLSTGTNCALINLAIHDNGNGVYFAPEATNSSVYGCVIYNNGWQSPDRGGGHGIYAQSDEPNHAITDNIFVNGFGLGIQCYAESGTLLGFQIGGNTSANNGILSTNGTIRTWNLLVGGHTYTDNAIVDSNYIYHATGGYQNFQLGYSDGVNNSDVTSSGNYIAGGYTSIKSWTNIIFTDNVLAHSTLQWRSAPSPVVNVCDYLTYFSTGSGPLWTYNGANYNFANWKSTTGFDANSQNTVGTPTGPVVFVRPNSYESGRANVTIYNWDQADNVAVDLSSVLTVGSVYRVRDGFNYLGPSVATGQYTGGTVAIPMTNLLSAVPVGRVSAPAHTGPVFGVFVVDTVAPSPPKKPRRNGGHRLGGL